MDSFGKEFLQGTCKEYILHSYIRYKEVSLDPFCYSINFISHIVTGIWKFPWTLLVKKFLISLNVTGHTEVFIHGPFWYKLRVKKIHCHVTYMEISIDHF